MPLPMMQFPIQTPEQMSPLMNAIPAFQQAYMNQLRIGNQRMQNQQMPQMQQQDLEKMRLANQMQQMQNQYYPQKAEAEIEAQKAMANYRNMGGGRMGVGQQQINALKNQVASENPDATPEQIEELTNAYLNGDTQLQDGSPVKPISPLAQSMVSQVQKRNSTPKLQNTAGMLDVAASELESIPVDSIAAFAGAGGRARYYSERTAMALGQPVSKEFRDYQSYIQSIQKYDMDALRQDFGTSVVPDYVQATIGATLDPTSSIWNDPEQVRKQFKDIKEWSRNTARLYGAKSKYGANAPIPPAPGMPAQPQGMPQAPQAPANNTITASDGKTYTREELMKIAAGGK